MPLLGVVNMALSFSLDLAYKSAAAQAKPAAVRYAPPCPSSMNRSNHQTVAGPVSGRPRMWLDEARQRVVPTPPHPTPGYRPLNGRGAGEQANIKYKKKVLPALA